MARSRNSNVRVSSWIGAKVPTRNLKKREPLHPFEEMENHVHRPGYEASQLNLLVSQNKALWLLPAILYSFIQVIRAEGH